MSTAERLRRVPARAWSFLFALVFGLVMLLPALGSFGFWDPWELNIADRAQKMVSAGTLTDTTAAGRFNPPVPPLSLGLAALGIKMFGANEFGARVLGALCGL